MLHWKKIKVHEIEKYINMLINNNSVLTMYLQIKLHTVKEASRY